MQEIRDERYFSSTAAKTEATNSLFPLTPDTLFPVSIPDALLHDRLNSFAIVRTPPRATAPGTGSTSRVVPNRFSAFSAALGTREEALSMILPTHSKLVTGVRPRCSNPPVAEPNDSRSICASLTSRKSGSLGAQTVCEDRRPTCRLESPEIPDTEIMGYRRPLSFSDRIGRTTDRSRSPTLVTLPPLTCHLLPAWHHRAAPRYRCFCEGSE